MKFENIWKAILTSTIGAVLMGLAVYGWYFDESLTNKEALFIFGLGFALLWIRGAIETALRKIIIELPSRLISKWFGNSGKTPIILLLMASSISSYAQNNKPINVSEARYINKNDSTLISGVGQQRWDESNKKFRFGDGASWHSYWKTQGFTRLENTVDFLLDDQASSGLMYSWRFNDPINGKTEATIASYGFDIQTKGGSFAATARVDDSFDEFGSFSVSPIGFQMTYTYDGGTKNDLITVNSGGIKLGVVDDAHQVIIEGGVNFPGAIYNSDYSANFLDNSLANVGWVRDEIDAIASSGDFTPTIPVDINISSYTAESGFYTKIGDVVSFSGWVNVTPNAGGATVAEITLPVATNIDGVGVHLVGTATYSPSASTTTLLGVGTSSTADRAVIFWTAPDATPVNISYTINYRVVP